MQCYRPSGPEIIGSNILFASFAVGTAINFFTNTGLFDSRQATVLRWAVAIVTLLFFGLFYLIRHGKRWAKILCAGLVSLGLLFPIILYQRTVAVQFTTVPRTINYVLQLMLQIVNLGATLYTFKKARQGWETQIQAALADNRHEPEGESP